jgi:hypothetical protein
VSTSSRVIVCQPSIMISFFGELFLGWELGSTHIVIRLLKLINTKCRLLSTKPCYAYSLDYRLSCHIFPTLAE